MAIERMSKPTYAEGLEKCPTHSQQSHACLAITELSLYSAKEKFYATITVENSTKRNKWKTKYAFGIVFVCKRVGNEGS